MLSDGLGDGDLAILDEAEQLVQRALRIDDSIPQVHFVKSQIEMYRGDLEKALRTMERAIEFKPGYADGYGMMAWILRFAGRPEAGLKVMDLAERLNPRIPSVYHLVRGANLYAIERYDEAVEILETASDISPYHPLIRLWLAAAYSVSERLLDAEWQIEELTTQNPDFSIGYLTAVFRFKDSTYLTRLIGHMRQAGLAD